MMRLRGKAVSVREKGSGGSQKVSLDTPDNVNVLTAVWKILRPNIISQVADLGQYLMLWAVVLSAHYVGIVMASAGVEPLIIRLISLMERIVFVASFAAFFWGILLRLGYSVFAARRGGDDV